MRQWPPLVPRTISARAPSQVSTRGATGDRATPLRAGRGRHLLVDERELLADLLRPELAGRSQQVEDARRARRASQASPSSASPAATTSLPILRRSVSATRALALPHTAGSRSRGNAKRVRRIASCLTRLRSAYSARSMSATVTSSARAATER